MNPSFVFLFKSPVWGSLEKKGVQISGNYKNLIPTDPNKTTAVNKVSSCSQMLGHMTAQNGDRRRNHELAHFGQNIFTIGIVFTFQSLFQHI
jgi:hypothetical protein